jgi:cation transport ATPase
MTTLHEGRAGAESRSIGELLRDLANDSTRLVRDELTLAKTEAQEKVSQVGSAVAMMAIGAVLAIPALVLILQAVVTVLSNFMWDWVAMLLVGIVIALVGYLLVRKGQNDLSAGRLAPERTAANLRRDVRLVQEKVS